MTLHIKVIVPGYNCEKWIEKCLNSIKSQTYTNWQAIIIDDVSTDNTAKIIDRITKNDSRFIFIQNTVRVTALANIVRGIQKANCNDEDVCAVVDGDDWLASPKSLSIVAKTYEDPNVWLTYGTFRMIPGDKIDNIVKPTPPNYDYRHDPFIWRHLRTFKRFLWKNVKDDALRSMETGDYFRSSYDTAMFRPMAELATYKHMKYIKKVLYIYNRGNPLCDGNVNRSLQAQCGAEIYWREPYTARTKEQLVKKEGPVVDTNKSKVLLITDVYGWTLHQIALQLKMRLSHKYNFTVVATDELVHTDADKFDVVYLLGAYTGKPPTFKLPVDKTILGVRADYYLPDDESSLRDFCEMKLKSRGKYFTLTNHWQLEKLQDFVSNLNVIPDGVDLNLFNYKKFVNKRINNSRLVVGYAGSSIGLKGIPMIQEACKSIDAVFHSMLRKADRTHLTLKEMPFTFYNKIDVYVCMSKSEGLCLPILEAGAMQLPVVSTRVGVANEIIKHGENGFLVDRNPTDLAKYLKILAEDKKLRREFGEKLQKEVAANWGWESVIDKFDNLFQRVGSTNE